MLKSPHSPDAPFDDESSPIFAPEQAVAVNTSAVSAAPSLFRVMWLSFGLFGAARRGLRDSVQHDAKQDDGHSCRQALAVQLCLREARHDGVSECTRTDQAADDHHRQYVD